VTLFPATSYACTSIFNRDEHKIGQPFDIDTFDRVTEHTYKNRLGAVQNTAPLTEERRHELIFRKMNQFLKKLVHFLETEPILRSFGLFSGN
jgi:hypothetical protein